MPSLTLATSLHASYEQVLARAITYSGVGSRTLSFAQPAQAVRRRNEVVGPGQWPGVDGEGVADTAPHSGHALEHPFQHLLMRAEADEHRAVVHHGAVRHVAAKDLAEPVLVRARNVRVCRLVLELSAVILGPPNHLLLPGDRKRLPGRCVVAPLLE